MLLRKEKQKKNRKKDEESRMIFKFETDELGDLGVVVDIVDVVPLTVKLPVTVRSLATVTEASLPVIVSAVVSLPPSLTLKIMFPSEVVFFNVIFNS